MPACLGALRHHVVATTVPGSGGLDRRPDLPPCERPRIVNQPYEVRSRIAIEELHNASLAGRGADLVRRRVERKQEVRPTRPRRGLTPNRHHAERTRLRLTVPLADPLATLAR
jgi:hypothetical protein